MTPRRSLAAPAVDAYDDHAQLLDRDPLRLVDRRLVLRVLERLSDRDHRVDEQAGQDVEVRTAPGVRAGEAGQVAGEFGSDEPDLGADRGARDVQICRAFAGGEANGDLG